MYPFHERLSIVLFRYEMLPFYAEWKRNLTVIFNIFLFTPSLHNSHNLQNTELMKMSILLVFGLSCLLICRFFSQHFKMGSQRVILSFGGKQPSLSLYNISRVFKYCSFSEFPTSINSYILIFLNGYEYCIQYLFIDRFFLQKS